MKGGLRKKAENGTGKDPSEKSRIKSSNWEQKQKSFWFPCVGSYFAFKSILQC